jgi:hypothetical protein
LALLLDLGFWSGESKCGHGNSDEDTKKPHDEGEIQYCNERMKVY